MQHCRCATLHDGTRVREATVSRDGRSQRTCSARATSNQAFVNVIISGKRAPSHRFFVAQVFRRNVWGKRRRRHRFSAFWLRIGFVPKVVVRSFFWRSSRKHIYVCCSCCSLLLQFAVPVCCSCLLFMFAVPVCCSCLLFLFVGPALVLAWSCLGPALVLLWLDTLSSWLSFCSVREFIFLAVPQVLLWFIYSLYIV